MKTMKINMFKKLKYNIFICIDIDASLVIE